MSLFRAALAVPRLAAIAEVKRRSPSAGDLRPRANAGALARAFEQAGAAAVSVIVDARFGGSVEDLHAARARTSLPLLAKGFFREEAALDTLRAAGADAVLLLLRDLDDAHAARLQARARALGMDALVEAHDAPELERAVALGADVIGINARDLRTFRIDRAAQLALINRAPRDRVIVAESGIAYRAQAAMAELAGADAVLVGSTLMRAADPAATLRELLVRPLVKICGLTREEDVAAAAEAGADLAGFVLAESPRRIAEPLRVPESMLSVGIVVGDGEAPDTDLVQRYEQEDGHRGRDAMLLRDGVPVARVLDQPFGATDPLHLRRAALVARRERVVLAGGLSPENVAAAVIETVPWCVDAARGVESAPGIKDHARLHAFVAAARGAEIVEAAS